MTDLPVEVWFLILEELRAPRCIPLRGVCRELTDLVVGCWYSFVRQHGSGVRPTVAQKRIRLLSRTLTKEERASLQ